jgi:hypothetical protein
VSFARLASSRLFRLITSTFCSPLPLFTPINLHFIRVGSISKTKEFAMGCIQSSHEQTVEHRQIEKELKEQSKAYSSEIRVSESNTAKTPCHFFQSFL